MVKVLLALTSAHPAFYPDGKKTGVFAIEAIAPFEIFKKKGYDVQFVSDTGSFGYDDYSLLPDFLNGENKKAFDDPNSEYNKALKNIKKSSEIDPADYDIFFASAGHGTYFDYPTSKHLQNSLAQIYNNGGVVSAVCHGPIIFKDLLDIKTGKPLIKGKKITGFTEVGEEILGVASIMEKDNLLTIKQVADKEGATYVAPAGPWDAFTVTDSRIVTGVNPQSAVKIAEDVVTAFESK